MEVGVKKKRRERDLTYTKLDGEESLCKGPPNESKCSPRRKEKIREGGGEGRRALLWTRAAKVGRGRGKK